MAVPLHRPRTDGGGTDGAVVVVLNPASGSGDHADRVHQLAESYGFAVRETGEAGDALEFARAAALDGVEVVAAAGGDGTVNQVIRGVVAADTLSDVCVGVIPAGTGNNFATNLGIEGIEHGFELVRAGERRSIDLGVANDRPFANSCVAGLTATASAETTSDRKERYGVLAYVLTTVETAVSYEGIDVHVEAAGDRGWSGSASLLLVGNARRFPVEGRTQADVEDGLLDVTIFEDVPSVELAGEAALSRLLGTDGTHLTRLQTPTMEVMSTDEEPMTVSLDGELLESTNLRVGVRDRGLTVPVGETYEPNPSTDGG